MAASSSRTKKKRVTRYEENVGGSGYMPEWTMIPPIIPAPKQLTRGWERGDAAIMAMAEKKNWYLDMLANNANWVKGLEDTNVDSWRWGSWNAMNLLHGLVQGDTETTRIGRKIKVVNLDIQMAYLMTHEADAGCICRTIVLLDTQTNGQTPNIRWKGNDVTPGTGYTATGSEVFEFAYHSAPGSTGGKQWLISPFNEANKKRYIILKDIWNIKEPKATGNSTVFSPCVIKEKIDCDIDITFSDNSGLASGMTTNSIWLLVAMYGWDSTISTMDGKIRGGVQTHFIDP